MTSLRLVLKAQGTRQNRRGRWLGIFAGAFFFVWLFGAYAFLDASTPPGQRLPGWPAILLIGLIPGAVWYVALVRPNVGRALGLTQAVYSQAVVDAAAIELSVAGLEPARYRWDDIAALERAGKDWRFVGPDGSTVTIVPLELALPKSSWFDAPTLAEAIVERRPDRYALRGGRFEAGLTEFALRAPGDPVGRVRTVMDRRVLGLGIVLFILANIALFWMLSQPR
jgi:hypothetical protein